MWKVLESFWKRQSVTRLLTIHIRQFSNYTAFSDIWPTLYYSYRFLLDSKNTIRHLLFTLSEIIAFSIKCFVMIRLTIEQRQSHSQQLLQLCVCCLSRCLSVLRRVALLCLKTFLKIVHTQPTIETQFYNL